MPNPFQRSKEFPYHISVGAVLVNEKGEVACHYFEHFAHFGAEANDFYILMRETLEPEESLETCLARGLQEEFGAKAEMKHFLGSIVCQIPEEDFIMNKTTLYFLCNLISIEASARKVGDPEGSSEIRWVKPNELIQKMKEQGVRIGRSDVDESSVLEKLPL